MTYTQDRLKNIFFRAVELFNETMDEEYEVCEDGAGSPSDIMLRFFTPENGAEVYREFCEAYFPHHLKENYQERERYEGIIAEAFVSENYNGVMIREDLSFPEYEFIQAFTHEISHLFCTRHEIEGGAFYERYCDAPNHPVYGENIDRQMNGCINAGYAVWREMIADVISVESWIDIYGLGNVDDQIQGFYDEMQFGNPAAKKAASLVIAYVMLTVGDAGIEEIRKRYPYFSRSMHRLLEGVYRKLKIQPFFEITPEFIAELGSIYLMVLTEKRMSR